MSVDELTSDVLKQKYAVVIPKSETFNPIGISKQDAKNFLNTEEGAIYWLRIAEADPGLPSADVDRRAIQQLRSGRELPRIETIGIDESLVEIVPAGTSPSAYKMISAGTPRQLFFFTTKEA